jgi:hypothetical protein
VSPCLEFVNRSIRQIADTDAYRLRENIRRTRTPRLGQRTNRISKGATRFKVERSSAAESSDPLGLQERRSFEVA